MRTFDYSPERVSLICGSEEITGFAKDSSITVRRTEKRFIYTPGIVDGMRTFVPNKHGEIVVNLLQGSPSNAVLFNFFLQDEDNVGSGVFSLTLSDKNSPTGLTIAEISAPFCWVSQEPEMMWSGNQEIRSWTLESGNISWKQTGAYSEAQAQDA